MERSFQTGDLVLGKYRVERVLGRGGMGVVLAVRHVELRELFAIKLLLARTLEDAHAVERFVREARAAAGLRSEHVAKVIDVGRLEDGAPYMVMEHLEGKDLAAVLRARGALPVSEAIEYTLQACAGLAEAHAAGIVHRDIKPANLFLTRRPNGSPCVKVLDFGISKQAQAGDIELTQTGAMLGSPQYMAPEQMRSTRAVDARGDIWSMGVVLYKLVTGLMPFPGEAAPEVIAGILEDEPPPPSAVRPGLPPELDAIVARALQKKPAARFQHIGELSAALRALGGDTPATLSHVPVAALTGAGQPAFDPAAPTLGGASFDAARSLRKRTYRMALAFAVAGAVAVLMTVAGFLLGSRWSAPAGEGAAAGAPSGEPALPANAMPPGAAAGIAPPPQGAATGPQDPGATAAVSANPTGSARTAAAPARPGKWAPRPSATSPAAAPPATSKPRTIF